MSMRDEIKNAQLTMTRAIPVQTNAPYDSGPITSRFSVETALMYEKIAPYAGNVFQAQVQGLDYEDFYKWTDCLIRSAPVVDASTGDNMNPDWQRIMIIDRHIDFLPIGAYVKFNNNVWIVYNPDNVTSDIGTGVVQRCNTTYNTLDWYGNIVKTPMVVTKGKVLASSPYYMEYSSIMDGYGHALIQYNENTKDIHDNTRFLLGNSAYSFYGVVNYAQEFTGNDDSVHIIKTDFRVNEIIETDDRENRVADGKGFSFDIDVPSSVSCLVNGTVPLRPICRRNGEIVMDTEEHPITLLYGSDNYSIASISTGDIHGSSAGETNVHVTLKENTSIRKDVSVTVENTTTNDYVSFIGGVPSEAPVFSSFTVEAAYYEDGIKTADQVRFSYSGVPNNSITLTENGDNTATIDIWTASGTLVLEAFCGTHIATAEVVLEGF